jgi:hypothetical protein
MSNWEEIFFDVDEPLLMAATTLASALALRTRLQERGLDVSGDPQETGLATWVYGSIELNDYAETAPEISSDVSIFDDMPYVFELRLRSEDYDLQTSVASELYRRMCSLVGWRSALTSGFASLRATYDAIHGYREFPEGTLSDATHADRWR